MKEFTRCVLLGGLVAAYPALLAAQATPPPALNFQGVLLDNVTGAPVDGDRDMIFHLYDSPSGGLEILKDLHTLAAGVSPIAVGVGLFNVQIGGGVVQDGSGVFAGDPYDSLAKAFRDFGSVYLEVEVRAGAAGGAGAFEILTPRTPVVSAAYALNADHLDGKTSSQFIDTSATAQVKTGDLTVSDLTLSGNDIFLGSPGARISGSAGLLSMTAGTLDTSFLQFTAGNSFDDGRLLMLGNAGWELRAGNGVFGFLNGDTGVQTATLDGTGSLQLNGDLTASGNDINFSSAGANISADASAFSITAGDLDTDDLLLTAGNSFDDGRITILGDSTLELRSGNGLFTFVNGASGAQTASLSAAGILHVANNLDVQGSRISVPDDSQILVAGIDANFTIAGSPRIFFFLGDNPNDFVQVPGNLLVTGIKDFVQNHPSQKDLSVVYAAIEGDEAATFTRGSGRLSGGSARVKLGETFAWVTNPDIGLTAHVTPRGGGSDLYVESVTTEELVVRARDAADSGAAFDYLVMGLRIGHEEYPVIRPKPMEGTIPVDGYYEPFYAKMPHLRRYNALERHARSRAEAGGGPLDLSTSRQLGHAIGQHAPVEEIVNGGRAEEIPGEGGRPDRGVGNAATTLSSDVMSHDAAAVAPAPELTARRATAGAERHVDALSFSAGRTDAAIMVEVSEQVEPGDLLAIDPERPGVVRLASTRADEGVIGIVTARSGLLLGAEPNQESTGRKTPGSLQGRAAVALAGIAPCKVDASYGPIRPGDLLTSSPTPGHAMRSFDREPGTIVAKALEPIESGTGLIRVLVLSR